MRITTEQIEPENQRVSFRKNSGELIESRDLTNPDVMTCILCDATLDKLEAIAARRERTLDISAGVNFYIQLNQTLRSLSLAFLFGERITNQTALRALRTAYVDLGPAGQRALLLNYVNQPEIRHRDQPLLFPRPESFLTAIDGLIEGSASGAGRRTDNVSRIRTAVIPLVFDLFETIGISPAVSNDGLLARFAKAVFRDPVLSCIGRLPEDIHPLLREIRDARAPATSGG